MANEVQVTFKCEEALKMEIDAFCMSKGMSKGDFFRKACIAAMVEEEKPTTQVKVQKKPSKPVLRFLD